MPLSLNRAEVIRMSEADVLSRNIHALKELQRVAWRNLADPALTIFERREIRNEIKQSDAVLRSYLEMMSDRSRFRERPVDADVADGFGKFEFRLLAGN
jgi:hypothetical protein